ncbi:metal-dependent hydrolase [Kineococcus sp. SYSU DK003]|uniref:metal-dependent hydrolase n=1 Tax=Kineococcus sp. SYSU DK003 TaxID=3383124 RepID=UPI003D7C636D
MMGPAHAASGLAAGALTLGVAARLGVDAPLEQLAWVLAWGGFAYLPDLDQKRSTAGSAWGPPTRWLAGVIGVLARRHRGGTHDVLVAPLAFGALAAAATLNRWTALVVLALAIGLALHAVAQLIPGDAEKTALGNLVLSFAGAWLLTDAGVRLPWLPVAVAGAVVVHIAGDALTTDGVPVPLTTWFRRRPLTVGLRLFDAGKGLEPALQYGVFPALTAYGLWQHLAVDRLPFT